MSHFPKRGFTAVEGDRVAAAEGERVRVRDADGAANKGVIVLLIRDN